MTLAENDYLQALDLVTAPPARLQLESVSEEARNMVLANMDWVNGPEVVGLGVTRKTVGGWPQGGQLAVVVYVRRKLPLPAVPTPNVVPDTLSLPGLDEALLTDVVAIGELQLESNVNRVRPVVSGYSVGSATGMTGSLGALVARQSEAGVPLLLSNAHVLADSGLAPAGAPVTQPGGDDGGQVAQDEIGTLIEAVAFIYGAGYENTCDAAVASISAIDQLDPAIPPIGVPTYDPAVTCVVDMQVQKTGRTTGHTVGIVRDVHFRTSLSYPRAGGGRGTVGFRDQVLCSRYTSKGDSGALVCDMAGHAVGLHWCGSQSVSVFSPIGFVLDALKLRLWEPPRHA